MKRVIVTLLLSLPVGSASGYYWNGSDLLRACEGSDAQQEKCLGYLQGVADAGELAKAATKSSKDAKDGNDTYAWVQAWLQERFALGIFFCIPEGIAMRQLQAAFVSWAKAHPTDLPQPAPDLVRRAFVQAWPCKP
ncbi:MAG: hypothetical protein GTO41_17495 [Burkholderiales bacterium]|nr:hypothetical protein [Burkholderiales bacterium]